MSPISDFLFESGRRRMERSLFFKIALGCISALFLLCVCAACVGLWFFLKTPGGG